MDESYKKVVKIEKKKFYKKIVKDLKQSNPNQWYSKLKRLCTYDMEKQEAIVCEQLEHLSDQEQANELVNHFSKIRCQFDALNASDIIIPPFNQNSIPQLIQYQVENELKTIKTKKSVPPVDIPPAILKYCAKPLSKIITHIFNSTIRNGVWPQTWKKEIVTPVAKVYPPQK